MVIPDVPASRERLWQAMPTASTVPLVSPRSRPASTVAPRVRYSARILYQELAQGRGFTGSYDVMKRFVAPLRALEAAAQAMQRRFETPPGQQSQIDWGQARVQFRCGTPTMHIFVLTLSRPKARLVGTAANQTL